MRYEVFIERSRDASPDAMRALATAVAARFGVPSESIAQRLAQGRFRVKGGIDLDKAKRFAALLESLGAECSIFDETGQRVGAPAVIDDGMLSLADPAPAAPAKVPTPPSDDLQLAAIDGSDYDATREKARAADDSSSVDAFLPPEMQREEAIDLLTPPPEMVDPAPAPPAAVAGDSDRADAADAHAAEIDPGEARATERPDPLAALAGNERLRIAVGAALAVVLGFFAAHLVASASEQGYAEIRAQLHEAQADADTEDRWVALDEIRAATLDRLTSKQSHVAITAILLWAVVGGLVTFVWHRKIDWSRWAVE